MRLPLLDNILNSCKINNLESASFFPSLIKSARNLLFQVNTNPFSEKWGGKFKFEEHILKCNLNYAKKMNFALIMMQNWTKGFLWYASSSKVHKFILNPCWLYLGLENVEQYNDGNFFQGSHRLDFLGLVFMGFFGGLPLQPRWDLKYGSLQINHTLPYHTTHLQSWPRERMHHHLDWSMATRSLTKLSDPFPDWRSLPESIPSTSVTLENRK